MGSILHPDVDTIVGWERLLQPAPHGQTDDGRQGAVIDGGRELDQNREERVRGGQLRGRWADMDIWQPHHRQLTQSMWVLRVRDGRNQIYEASVAIRG